MGAAAACNGVHCSQAGVSAAWVCGHAVVGAFGRLHIDDRCAVLHGAGFPHAVAAAARGVTGALGSSGVAAVGRAAGVDLECVLLAGVSGFGEFGEFNVGRLTQLSIHCCCVYGRRRGLSRNHHAMVRASYRRH